MVVIHYQGAASRLDEIVAIARDRGIKVVEDVAQAFGGSFKGKKLGKWGDISCFSLQTHKMITTGEGGVIATDDQVLFERSVRFHDLGMIRENFKRQLEEPVKTRPMLGMQWRMNELSGAVAVSQIRKLPGIVEKTKGYSGKVRKTLVSQFPDLKLRLVRPEDDIGILVCFDLRTAENVDCFKKAFQTEGFMYGPSSYCQSMADIPETRAYLEETGTYNPKDFTKTKEIESRFAKIAMIPFYSEKDVDEIIAGIIKVLAAMRANRMI